MFFQYVLGDLEVFLNKIQKLKKLIKNKWPSWFKAPAAKLVIVNIYTCSNPIFSLFSNYLMKASVRAISAVYFLDFPKKS